MSDGVTSSTDIEQSGTKQKVICGDCTTGFIVREEATFCPYCGGANVR